MRRKCLDGQRNKWSDSYMLQIEIMQAEGYTSEHISCAINDSKIAEKSKVFKNIEPAELYKSFMNYHLEILGYNFHVDITEIGDDDDIEYLITDDRLDESVINSIKLVS